MKGNQRKYFFANRLHKELFWLVFFATIVPSTVVGVGLFYLIFNVTAEQIGFPEAIASNLFPAAHRVIGILSVVTPLVILIIIFFAYQLTHRAVGFFDRLDRTRTDLL